MKEIFIALLLVIFFLIPISGYLATTFSQTRIVQKSPEVNITVPEAPKKGMPKANVSYNVVRMKVPAVDNEGNGVATDLILEVKPGQGRILVNINQLSFWVDTQYSIRVANEVAQGITGLDFSSADLIYTIETNASIIGGESAGAALTVATIAAIKNETPNPEVMITGTIKPDGSVGPVGAIVAKAVASKESGAKIFFVPEGQSSQIHYKAVRKCEKIGIITYCTTEYIPEKIDIAGDVGIEVKEVSNIQEVLKYFLE